MISKSIDSAICTCLAFVSFSISSSAYAAFVTYSNRAAWEAGANWQASGDPLSGFEDFKGFTIDTQFRTEGVTIAGMTVSAGETVNGDSTNLIDVPNFQVTGNHGVNGTTALVGDVDNNGVSVSFVFDSPLVAWGASFKGLDPLTKFDVLDENNVVLGSYSSNTVNVEFLGFKLTGGESAYSMNINYPGNSNDYFNMDDMAFVTTVPAPPAIMLFASGLLGLAGLARRKMRA